MANDQHQHNDTAPPYKPEKRLVAGYCTQCLVRSSPQFRQGPAGPATLCNACGLKYRKRRKDNAPKAAPTNTLKLKLTGKTSARQTTRLDDLVQFAAKSLASFNATLPETHPEPASPPRIAPPRTAPPRIAPPRTAPPRTTPPRTAPPRTTPPRTPPPRTPPPRAAPLSAVRITSPARAQPVEQREATQMDSPRRPTISPISSPLMQNDSSDDDVPSPFQTASPDLSGLPPSPFAIPPLLRDDSHQTVIMQPLQPISPVIAEPTRLEPLRLQLTAVPQNAVASITQSTLASELVASTQYIASLGVPPSVPVSTINVGIVPLPKPKTVAWAPENIPGVVKIGTIDLRPYSFRMSHESSPEL